MEADLARQEPILVELGITGAGGGIHLVGALPGEADAGRAVAAVEAALDRAEDELAATLPIEGDVGWLDQVEDQVDALRRLRNGGSQLVRVEHVHVHEGAQAVAGVISAS